MSRVVALALNTFREAIRNKILYSLLFFALALIISALALGQVSLHEEARVTRDVGLGGMALFGVLIAIFGGMFVVPLYAFLTTFVPKSETARTIAANNIVNSGAMVLGSLIAVGLSAAGVAIVDQLLLVAAMCLASAWFGQLLYRAECAAKVTQ